MKLSLMTLGDQVVDPITGINETAAERHRAIVDASVDADQAGFHGVHVWTSCTLRHGRVRGAAR